MRKTGRRGGWGTDKVEDGAGMGREGVACTDGEDTGADGHTGEMEGRAGLVVVGHYGAWQLRV